jgi:hypothetical protein
MFLVYINEIGSNWTGNNIYEFLFSSTIDNIDGDDWDVYPASGQPSPPHAELVSRVGTLTSDFKITLIQNSDTFALWDAVDGIVALGWEDISDYDTYPDTRTHFMFGETLEVVHDKLYANDLILEYNTNKQIKSDED